MRKIDWGVLGSVLRRSKQQARPDLTLVVGLGNPGPEYARTRHNVGFWCVERLAKEGAITFSRRHRLAAMGEGVIAGKPVALAKPKTFVNNSGQAIASILARYRASPANLLVVCDDMNLPLGTLRVRPRGSAGGHNGMKSIIAAIGTQEFARVRIGIGRPQPGVDQVGYVLGRMSPEEQSQAHEALGRAVQAVICVLNEGIDAAMNRFN